MPNVLAPVVGSCPPTVAVGATSAGEDGGSFVSLSPSTVAPATVESLESPTAAVVVVVGSGTVVVSSGAAVVVVTPPITVLSVVS